jgi:hypothetical protein
MIPTLGRLAHESYRAQEVKDGDVLIMVAKDVPDGLPGRGELLAQALQGRYAPSLRGYYLTPARARKWHALFMGGATAKQRMTRFGKTWVFVCKVEEHRHLPLADALRIVSPKLEVCA